MGLGDEAPCSGEERVKDENTEMRVASRRVRTFPAAPFLYTLSPPTSFLLGHHSSSFNGDRLHQ